MQQLRKAQVEYWQNNLSENISSLAGGGVQPLIRYPVLLDSARARAKALQQGEQYGMASSYPEAVHRIPQLKEQFSEEEYPIASNLAETLVTLPVHRYVGKSDRSTLKAIAMNQPFKKQTK